jgi:hypothetical protein
MAAQITGTSNSPQALIPGQPAISIPGGVAIAAAGGGLAAGGVGQPFAMPAQDVGHDFTWDLIITGTAPATLEVDLEESLDQAFTIAAAQPGVATAAQADTFTGVASTTRHVTNKQTLFLRLNIVTLTGGDATTRIQGRIFVAKRGGAN